MKHGHASSSDDQIKKPSRMKSGSKKTSALSKKGFAQRQRLRKVALEEWEPNLDSTVESLGREVQALIPQVLALRMKYNQLLVQGKVLHQAKSMPLPTQQASQLQLPRSAVAEGCAPAAAPILSPSSSATEEKRNQRQQLPDAAAFPQAAPASDSPRQTSLPLAKSSSQQLIDLSPEQLDFSDLIAEALASGPSGLGRSMSASLDSHQPRHSYLTPHTPPPELLHGPFASHVFNCKMQSTFSDSQGPALGIPVDQPGMPPHAYTHPYPIPQPNLPRHRSHSFCPPSGPTLDRSRSTPLPFPDLDTLAPTSKPNASPSSHHLTLMGRSKSMLLHSPPSLGMPVHPMHYSNSAHMLPARNHGGGDRMHHASSAMRSPPPHEDPDHAELLQDEDEATMDYLAQVVLGPVQSNAMQHDYAKSAQQQQQQQQLYHMAGPLSSPRQAAHSMEPPSTPRGRMQQQHYPAAHYPGSAEEYMGMQMQMEEAARWEAEAYGHKRAPHPSYMYVDVGFMDPDEMLQDAHGWR